MFKDATLDYISSEPVIAKQVVRSLEKEVIQLRNQLGAIVGFDGKTDQLVEIEEWLQQRQKDNELLRKKAFDRSSGKKSDKNDSTDKQKDKRTKPSGSGRGKVGEQLPLFTEEYHLGESALCNCGMCESFKRMNQAETTIIVDYKPAKLIRREILRWKYRGSQGCIITAQGPTTLVDGGQYGIDLACEVVVRKFQDQLPWERQRKAFARDGLKLAMSTMWNQSKHVADLLEVVYEGIRKDVESGFLRHADETRWRILEKVKNKTQYVWVFRNKHHAYFTIEDSRSGEVPQRVMNGAAGALAADDYAGYNALIAENELIRIQCWAHTQRKFKDIRENYPQVETFLDLVSDLYKADIAFHESGSKSIEDRQRLCLPIIEAIDVWRKNQSCLPKSSFGRALHYIGDNWTGLVAFLTDVELPLDNNPAENALRQIVLGRKNFLFNRSKEGARVTAILYTICISCSLNNLDPKKYIRETILRIRNCRGFQLPYDFANQHEPIDLI